MSAFSIKRGDTGPTLTAVLSDDNGVINLAGATILFTMRKVYDPDCETAPPLKVSAAATIVDSPNGKCAYAWVAADTDTAGEYLAEFHVTIAGLKMTYPSAAQIAVTVLDSVT